MDGTPLVFGLGRHFAYGFQHTKILVTNNKFHAIQTTDAEPLEETDPAGLVLLHALSSAKNLTVSILIDRYCHKNGYIFKFSAPVTAQGDPIHIDIRIPPILQKTVPPIFDVDIRLLVQFTDGGGRDFAAPQGLGLDGS